MSERVAACFGGVKSESCSASVHPSLCSADGDGLAGSPSPVTARLRNHSCHRRHHRVFTSLVTKPRPSAPSKASFGCSGSRRVPGCFRVEEGPADNFHAPSVRPVWKHATQSLCPRRSRVLTGKPVRPRHTGRRSRRSPPTRLASPLASQLASPSSPPLLRRLDFPPSRPLRPRPDSPLAIPISIPFRTVVVLASTSAGSVRWRDMTTAAAERSRLQDTLQFFSNLSSLQTKEASLNLVCTCSIRPPSLWFYCIVSNSS